MEGAGGGRDTKNLLFILFVARNWGLAKKATTRKRTKKLEEAAGLL